MKNKNWPSINNLPKVALVLSGGSARGLAHLGVLSVLEEYKIPIDIIVATSYGSIVGGYYAYGYSIPVIIKMAKDFKLWSVLDISKPWLRILSNEKVESIFRKDLKDAVIENLNIPLFILAADIKNNQMLILEKGLLSTALTASSSFPGLLAPVMYDDHLLIDGGIMNKMMVNIAREKGAEITIFSDVCIFTFLSRKSSVKKMYHLLTNHVSKRREKLEQKLKKVNMRYILYKTLCIVQDYWKQQELFKSSPPEFTIEPLMGEIKPLKFHMVDEGYKLGREATLKMVNDIVSAVYDGKQRENHFPEDQCC